VIAGAFVLSLVFFALMLFVARRSYDLWALFAVIAVGAVFGGLPDPARTRAFRGTVVLAALMAAHAAYRNQVSLANAHPRDEMRQAAEWIGRHSVPGEIVHNVCWDSFPMLFAWNRTNRYTTGMDPIFLYARDPGLYWETLHLQHGGATATTCRSARCTPDTRIDTHRAVREHLGASWLFVEKERTPSLYLWARADPRFAPGYEDEVVAVFRVADVPGR
jgi:hypothetical protein